MFLIDEYILPSEMIISQLLDLRGTHSDHADNLGYPTSESQIDGDQDIGMDAPGKRAIMHLMRPSLMVISL